MDHYLTSLIDEIVSDLKIELSEDEEGGSFSETLLKQKVKSAVREVVGIRKYPSSYTSCEKSQDINNFYSLIRNLALYDYNQIGVEFESGHDEKNIKREYVSRSSLLYGICPIAKII